MIKVRKITINNLTINQLMAYNVHLALHKKFRNTENNNFLYTTPQNVDVINLQYTLTALRRILPIISQIAAKGGRILTILNSTYKPFCLQLINENQQYQQRFLFAWKPGLLSNFKEFRRQTKYYYHKNIWSLPHFILYLTPEYQKDLQGEIKSFKIPCAKMQDQTDINYKFLYTIASSTKNTESKLFILSLIQTAIINGYTKKTLRFSAKKYLKKRLFS